MMPESQENSSHKERHSRHSSHYHGSSGRDEAAYMRKKKQQEKESHRRQRKMMRRKKKEMRKHEREQLIRKIRYLFSFDSVNHFIERRKMILSKRKFYWKASARERKKKFKNFLNRFSWSRIIKSYRMWILEMKKDWKAFKARLKERRQMRKMARQEARIKFRFYLRFYGNLFSSIFKIKGEYFKILANSTFFYILSHITIYLVYQFITILVAHQYKLPTILYYYKTAFPTPPTSPLWTENNIINTFGSGPMVLFLLGVLFYFLFGIVKKQPGMLKIFILWLYMQSIGYFIGSIIAGTITLKYLGWSLAWMGALSFLPKLALLPFLVVLFVIGYQSIRLFIQTSTNFRLIGNLESIRKYLFSVTIIPYLIGNVIVFLTKLPELHPYEILIYFSMSFMIFPFMINFRDYGMHNIATYRKEFKFPVKLVVFTIVLLAIFRIWLGYGIHFV